MDTKTREECQALGLDADHVSEQQQKLLPYLPAGGPGPSFKILDTCRLDNGRIFPADTFARLDLPAQQGSPSPSSCAATIAAFVPAAGAASRYIEPLEPLLTALSEGERVEAKKQLYSLRRYENVLPKSVRPFLQDPSRIDAATNENLKDYVDDFGKPKALFPCNGDGVSFLTMKQREHAHLKHIGHQFFIAPQGYSESFRQVLEAESGTSIQDHITMLEQGPPLSTLRYYSDGEPARDAWGQLSPVPSGHGALVKLFPKVRALCPGADSLFIRNIDNVMGVGVEALAATECFLTGHQKLLHAVRGIRTALCQGDSLLAAARAEALANEVPCRKLEAAEVDFLDQAMDSAFRSLWKVLFCLFQTPLSVRAHSAGSPNQEGMLEELTRLYHRPVNSLGQVPNNGTDIGGSPVLVETSDGPISVCLERAHARPEDEKKFLLNPQRATHFNPVYVAAEIPEPGYYEKCANPFWLLAKKTWMGTQVFYHETALYEMLGNCKFALCVFLEVPRIVFHPHKTLQDTIMEK